MTTEMLWIITVLAFLLAAFFAGAETAFLAADRIRLRHLSRRGDPRAKLVLQYIANPEYFLSIVLVGTNLGVIGCTTTFTAIMIRHFEDAGATAATAILVPTLLIFEEIIPKGIFLYYADRATIVSIFPLKFFAVILFPVIKSLSLLADGLARAFGIKKMRRKVTMTMEELLFHLEGSRDAGLISRDTMTLASRAYELVELTAKDIMLPIDRVVMVDENATIDEYHRVFAKERFSTLPVYRGDRRTVIGFLSIQNLLKARRPGVPRPSLENLYVVGTDAPILEIIVRMKNQGCHMAMVLDKTQRIVGMTTLEDILERLVGTIADEFH